MIPVVVLIGLLLFYGAAVPVKFSFMLRISRGLHFGAGLSLFDGSRALRSARARALGEKQRWAWKRPHPDLNKSAFLAAARRALRYFLARLELEQLRAEGRISTADAAVTALICGGARAVQGAVSPLLPPGRLRIALQPDFGADRSDAAVSGMVSIRAGHIIFAALIGAWNYFILTRREKHGKASD